MEGITKAIKKGAAVTYSQGFFDRNNLVGVRRGDRFYLWFGQRSKGWRYGAHLASV